MIVVVVVPGTVVLVWHGRPLPRTRVVRAQPSQPVWAVAVTVWDLKVQSISKEGALLTTRVHVGWYWGAGAAELWSVSVN